MAVKPPSLIASSNKSPNSWNLHVQANMAQWTKSSQQAAWLDKKPVRNDGLAAHWPFSVAGGLLTLHRTQGLSHLSSLLWRQGDSRAPGLPCIWPGSEGDMAWPQNISRSMTPVDLLVEDWSGDPPPGSGMKEREKANTGNLNHLQPLKSAKLSRYQSTSRWWSIYC